MERWSRIHFFCKQSKCRFIYGIFLLFILVFSGCNKNNKSSNITLPVQITVPSPESVPNTVKQVPVLHTIDPVNIKLSSLPYGTSAHGQYLNDPLVFSDLPDGGIPDGPTAVVGSDICLFYPIENISSNDELEKLPEGELIPFAAIILLGDKLQNGNPNKGNMFEFQDNLNFFYRTSWNGKRGIVFGADLYGIGKPNEENRVNALLYKLDGSFDNFYSFVGYERMGGKILEELEINGIAFQEVKKTEYYLSLEQPDDMISLYMNLIKKTPAPIFVTTDLAAHANHLVFDRMLQYLEENYFFPRLADLTSEYIRIMEQKKGQIPEEVHNAAILYFRTAEALLELAPKRTEGKDYYKTIEYMDVDADQVLQEYPSLVLEEIDKIFKADGFDTLSIFGSQAAPELLLTEDYSQYKVRGHYTKNGILGAYFRTLMWYGRINFNLGGEAEDIKKLAAHLAPIALFIADITENSPELKRLWQSLFDPITELIGASDDIGFNELIPLWNRIKGAGFLQWYSDPDKREAFISREYKELRSPSVSGSSLFSGPFDGGSEPEQRLIPLGWRFLGQRYTLDSEIHNNVSPPRLMSRDMVRGLDILKVFGSKTADWLLKESDYREMPGLEETLNFMQRRLEDLKDDYWLSTYYTNILYQIKTLGLFENGSGFYFTEKPGWNLKAINSALGTWAELRHDTILYVKQNYAERAGDGDWEPTFRTKRLPEPIHYIEPNIPFWAASAMGIEKIYSILEKYNFLDGKTAQALSGMHELFNKAMEISMLESDNQEVSRSDLTWISRIASRLAYLVVTHTEATSGWVEDTGSLRMALVADVYTNAELRLVLETAVGIPYRLYIPLNDRQGGKRTAIGYGFSYYEFNHPMSQRLNNDEWKALVYSENPDMSRYLPFWMQGRVQSPN